MAVQVFKEKLPSDDLRRHLLKSKLDYMVKTEDPESLRSISAFYRELDECIAVLERKYTTDCNYKDVEQVVGTKKMVIRCLKKIHSKIYSRLRSTPNLASPWKSNFTMDVSYEVFNVIVKRIVERNSFGHSFKETSACITVNFTDIRKARFVLDKVNLDGFELTKADLLKKKLPSIKMDSVRRCEVIVSEEKPLKFKYFKNKELLSVCFYYGYWNDFGVAQH